MKSCLKRLRFGDEIYLQEKGANKIIIGNYITSCPNSNISNFIILKLKNGRSPNMFSEYILTIREAVNKILPTNRYDESICVFYENSPYYDKIIKIIKKQIFFGPLV